MTNRPLADRMRPTSLEGYFGQSHLLQPKSPLRSAIEQNSYHSMLFWGPPGTGKTTLAKIIAHQCDAKWMALSAVLSGVKEIRLAIEQAVDRRNTFAQQSILFVDEIHRFNKAQQDVFLPHIENGTIIFIGATTENPSFELNNALLSRLRVYRLEALMHEDIKHIIQYALNHDERLKTHAISIENDALEYLVESTNGDARQGLNWLEIASDLTLVHHTNACINQSIIQLVVQKNNQRFDKKGDIFYEQISALHKSIRGSEPDAALYWFVSMTEGGCDPLYVARRVVRIASEDIGNADPRGLDIALNAWQVYERLGSPEGELAIAQAVIYLACAPKSNAVYVAYQSAKNCIQSLSKPAEVPMHLRNAPTQLMKHMDYGKNYRYAHDENNAYAAGECYFPKSVGKQQFYYPTDRGLEKKISAKLAWLRQQDNNQSE